MMQKFSRRRWQLISCLRIISLTLPYPLIYVLNMVLSSETYWRRITHRMESFCMVIKAAILFYRAPKKFTLTSICSFMR
uniref:Uncharacterized protein n=1 Tax=Rhizophora mucronata TaxID=61149 RepID=A0A2P2QHA0_RHIMU